MFGLRTVITISILAVVILADSESSDEDFVRRPSNNHGPLPCNSNPNKPSNLPPCSEVTESTSRSTIINEDNLDEETTLIDDGVEDATTDMTALERAHWCRFSNGTYVPYDHKFLHSCALCRCTKSRAFRCQALECMPTFCSDNTKPIRPKSECCTRCASDPPANSCVYNGTTYPHGIILKAVQGEMQCWCQLGNVECRQYIGTLFDSFNMMGTGIAMYIVVIIIFMLMLFGLLICCGCTIGIYYYYQRNQQSFQEAYDQYVNSAGWQPMEEEEIVVDPIAEEKRLEAEKSQFFYDNQDVIPPPYDVYNGAYVSGQEQK